MLASARGSMRASTPTEVAGRLFFYRCRQQGLPLIGQRALHDVVQQRLQCCADARPGGDADVHQIRAVHGQLAHGVAAGFRQLVHAALKGGYIGAAGGVAKAVAMAKAYAPFVRKIEIEVENLDQTREAVEAGADIIMLDNMTPEVMKQAVELIDGRAQTECSGNVTKENVARLVSVGVDYISSGALTHSAPILDISMKNLHPVNK